MILCLVFFSVSRHKTSWSLNTHTWDSYLHNLIKVFSLSFKEGRDTKHYQGQPIANYLKIKF